MARVSIIVPVYNAESFLKRCVDSILSQTFTDYEIILIDDGSTDESGKICDYFASTNPQVRVFHQTNQGVSAARQAGLDAAEGEYVIFADPDDWVEPTMLEELTCKADKSLADVVFCDFFLDATKTLTNYKSQSTSELLPGAVMRQMLTGELHGSTCNKLYRMETIRKYDITFPADINYCEDLWFNCKLLIQNGIKVDYLENAFYHYDFYTNNSGLSRRFSSKSVKDYIAFTDFAIDHLNEQSQTDRNIILFLKEQTKRIAFRSNCCSNEYNSIHPELRKVFISNVKSSKKHWSQKLGEILALNGFLGLGRGIVRYYELLCVPVLKIFKGV